jgi:hypothetical protein
MNHDNIDSRAREIDADNKVRELGTRTRGAIIEYFDGEDLTGKIHQNTNTYAAFVAVVTDSGVSGFEGRRHKNVDALRRELGDAFRQAGFVTSEGELAIPGRDSYDEIPGSIGPLMPGILAILEIEHGIESTEAVRTHRPDSLEIISPDSDEEQKTEEPPDRDWDERIRSAPGFSRDADAYVYVLELERLSDASTWFYVGKWEGSVSDLPEYIENHASKFTRSRVISYEGHELLFGDYDTSIVPQGITHHVVDVEQIVSISVPDISALNDVGAESSYVEEIERRTAYEIAIEHETTNVLGGK